MATQTDTTIERVVTALRDLHATRHPLTPGLVGTKAKLPFLAAAHGLERAAQAGLVEAVLITDPNDPTDPGVVGYRLLPS